MKHALEFIHYDGPNTYRGKIPLPNISPEEFDTGEHMATVFQFPKSDLPINPMLYVWKTCLPENDAELQKLISMGKMCAFPPRPKPNA